MDWSPLLFVLLSLAWGIGSAVVPLLNAEAYVVAAQLAPDTTTRAIGIGVAVAVATGQTVGKAVLFLAARRGTELAHLRRRARPPRAPGRLDPWRRRLSAMTATLLALVSSPRWGIPIVALAAVVGVPPIYAVALIAGASRMRLPIFVLTTWLGRVLRFVLIAEGVTLGLAQMVPH